MVRGKSKQSDGMEKERVPTGKERVRGKSEKLGAKRWYGG